MQEMIQKIIELDKQARRLTDEARERRANAASVAEIKRKEVYDSYLAMAYDRVESIRKVEKQESSAEIQEMERRCRDNAQRLRDSFGRNHTMWVKKIVAGVTEGDDLK